MITAIMHDETSKAWYIELHNKYIINVTPYQAAKIAKAINLQITKI